ncbi:MAG: PD-(D/E)XK nuclease family protein [Bacteroidales bacterium]|nr:PD-(D/E)XK nuclease family protein [Bacteroidales bacterium]MCD8395278.1 PD-(D/E)XK nuclease family protein [Bacteroidales bacterium]
MQIYYLPDYTSEAWLNLADRGGIAYDTTVVNTDGLASLLELRLGIHADTQPQPKRQAQWMKLMRQVMEREGNSLSKAWLKNALGVSNECLKWRDALRIALWNNEMPSPNDRLELISRIDKQFDMPSLGDRLISIAAALHSNPFESGTVIKVGVFNKESLQGAVVKLLHRLKELGVDVVYDKGEVLAAAGSNLAKAQELLIHDTATDDLQADDDSLLIWEFESSTDATRYIASIGADSADVYVTSNGGKLFDDTQRMMGQPTSGATIDNASPQIAQMFMLGMNLLEYPLNINNLLSWLQLPVHPIKSELRGQLVNAILDTNGFDNERYTTAIDEYLASLEDDKEIEKARKSLEQFDMRPQPDGVDMATLRKFNNALGSWAAQMTQIETMEDARRKQLGMVAELCDTLDTLITDIPEATIPYRRLEAAISTLFQGMRQQVYEPQCGSRHTVSYCEIIDTADRVMWTDCYNYAPAKYPYDFLNSRELEHFAELGCRFPSTDDFNREAIRLLRMPVLRARKRCVIVTSNKSAGADTTEHPLITRLKNAFSHTLCNITVTPDISEVETASVAPVCNYTEDAELQVNCALPMPKGESYTSLEHLIQYPLDYVLEKVARIYNRSSTDLKQLFTIKGDVAHKVIERLFTGNADEIANNIREHFDSTVDETLKEVGAVLLLPENELELRQYLGSLRECVDALLEIIRHNHLNVEGREQRVDTHLGLLPDEDDPAFKGFIDMVLSDKDGNLVVFDFKWSGSRSYHRRLLEHNLSLQLAIYKRLLEIETGKRVVATAYFIMPRHRMYTVSEALHGPNVEQVTSMNIDDLVEQAINAYRFRREQLEQGLIENAELKEIEETNYGASQNELNLFPLSPHYKNEALQAENKFSNYKCFKFGSLQ